MHHRLILLAVTLLALVLVLSEAAHARRKTPPAPLQGIWTDIWRDEIFIWQEGDRLIGAYTWAGAPAAFIGVVKKKAVTLRYYQAGGRDGEARCFVESNAATLNCRYVSTTGLESGQWILKKISDRLPNR